NAARHHRPASIARPKSLAGALDQEPLSLPRSAQPCTDRTAEASSDRRYRRARGAGNPSDHQRDSRRATQQRLVSLTRVAIARTAISFMILLQIGLSLVGLRNGASLSIVHRHITRFLDGVNPAG